MPQRIPPVFIHAGLTFGGVDVTDDQWRAAIAYAEKRVDEIEAQHKADCERAGVEYVSVYG